MSTPPPRPTRVVQKSRALVENEENEATLTQEDVRTTIEAYFQPLIEKLAKGSEEACNSDESRGSPPAVRDMEFCRIRETAPHSMLDSWTVVLYSYICI